jgi:hypothetical protein
MRRLAFAFVIGALFAPAAATAQDRPARRQQPIEIRGQVPTPQVVTVRPREVPAYSRRVLVPNFYDRRFWPAILNGYRILPRGALGAMPFADSLAARDSSARPAAPSVRPDSVRPPSGTPPARREE